MKLAATLLITIILTASEALALDPMAALSGTWRYSDTPDLSDGHDRVVSRSVHFEDNGGVFMVRWIRDFSEFGKGKLLGELRYAGFSREQYQALRNDSLGLIWPESFETLRPAGLDTLDALQNSELASKPKKDRVKDGKASNMGGTSEHMEVLVFLNSDVFLLVQKTAGRTSVTRYERATEK